ncbi:polysaccharide biosynthesis/export family protein [Methylorubrum populi]|uniref:Polysaccharide biosynthesis/export family protein n=2 Tax=Pseudomonadota TaxID=1224 RepID=A0ABU9ZIW9_9HYPH|nr:polysaccharide biosynthesis/export family protein [Methylorubrum rhodesianum]MBK3401801.1 polysaccharide biosynthesis/export family protein [Methylorubrum rhodesianum]MBY0141207.1 polysaccharide biosynthesis/export family protein [Methylorubrum populi]
MLDLRTFRPWNDGRRRGPRVGAASGTTLRTRLGLVLGAMLGGALLLGLAGSPLAAEAQAPSPTPVQTPQTPLPEPPAEAALLLSSGDKLTMVVFGQTDLTGEYVVDAVGDLNLPLVGRVRVAGLSPEQAETLVRTRLNDGFLRSATVSLRLSEMKPVYVLGEVRSPGSYTYRYGLTVLGAVALAGGGRVGDRSITELKAEVLTARERLRSLELARLAQRARQLRLEAQRDGRTSFVSDELIGPEATALLRGEQEIFSLQRETERSEVGLLRQQVERLETERASLTQQRSLIDEQVKLTEAQVRNYARLTDNGHGLQTIMVDRQRENARVRAELARIDADLARNATASGEMTLRQRDTENGHRRRVVADLQATRQQLLETEASLPIARDLLESRVRRLAASDGGSEATGWSVEVTRTLRDGAVTFKAALTSVLLPGDVVQVSPAKAGTAERPAPAPARDGAAAPGPVSQAVPALRSSFETP